jgi:hypothetical protein
MGDYRITVEATGGHGCSRKTKSGEKVEPCGWDGCPDCRARAFVEKLRTSGNDVRVAKLEHWPVPGAAGTTRTENPGPVDDLLTGVRQGEFEDAKSAGFGRIGALVAAAVLALAGLLAAPAAARAADRPADTPPPPRPAFAWSSYSFAETAFTQGGNKRAIVGARATAAVALPYGLQLSARADASALQDGGAVQVDIEDPQTYSTLELYGALSRPLPVVKGLSAEVIYGIALPIEFGRLVLLERYPKTFAAGVRYTLGKSTVHLDVGTHDPAGDGVRVLASAQLHLAAIDERTYLFADGAFGRGSYYRGGVALRLK